MQAKMNEESEKLLSKGGTMNDIHQIVKENPTLKKDLIASFQAPINLLNDVSTVNLSKKNLLKHLLQRQT